MKHSHTTLTTVKCKNCSKNLKLNLVERKQSKDLYCYKCFRIIIQGKTPSHNPRKKRQELGLPTH